MSYLLPYTLDTDRVSLNLEFVASEPPSPVILLLLLPLLLPGACMAVPVWVLGTGTVVKCSHPLSGLPGPVGSFLTFFFCPVSPLFPHSFPCIVVCPGKWKCQGHPSLMMGASPRARGALSSEATLGSSSVCLPVLFSHRVKQGLVVSLSPHIRSQRYSSSEKKYG